MEVGKQGLWQVGVSRDSYSAKNAEMNFLLLTAQTYSASRAEPHTAAVTRTTAAEGSMKLAACWKLWMLHTQ